MVPMLKLKAGKEANVGFRHPWVFSGALEEVPEGVEHGAVVKLADRRGVVIGTGTYSATSSIAVRVFEFGEAEIDDVWIERTIRACDERRRLVGYGPGTETTGYRVVFGEADGLPGLVVDRYADTLVFQISTAGTDRLRELVVQALEKIFKPAAVVERSDLPVREEEHLEEVKAPRAGSLPERVEFSEAGLNFFADVMNGQKTGFFLDQKDLRHAVGRLAAGREALNLFSYTGAAGVAAMKGGASRVHNVDASETALEGCKRHAEMNGIDQVRFTVEAADVFQFLSPKKEPEYDMVLLDPPALIKSRGDAEEGKKAYHFLNRAAMRLVRDGGLFVTSSCSQFMPEEDLAFALRRASVQAGVTLSVLKTIRQSSDHPLSVYFPEASYLKSFVCQVQR